ncbi:carboxypeptidase-like regulatory domain-containing protein [Pedobacter jejuensis]|uniref:Carboxypeptidase-like regulatory domain-containing protein n=1 Tax=Pedobacter jejuensis TaxID=1268550 RepID=A0A3N0C1Z8_9SPHI|nr:carboxypeptidase-like regulatory domain-containing protein [Pedobacter jejuensis]RNL56452.1 carboxypeptidase-like regulatory domain-containing protein [Pedobacter jejuensis]
MIKNTLFILFLIVALKGYTQNIQGKVIDEVTGAPIPFASLMIIGTSITSITNENGDFVIKATALPARLKFSHVSYLNGEFDVKSNAENLVIKLKQAAINLSEINISPYRGKALLKSAFEKASKYKDENHYLQAFYRQLTSVNNNPTKIHEIFYDLRWNVTKTTGWIAKQTRFAESKSQMLFDLSNQSYFTFSASGYLTQPSSGTFVTEKTLDKYTIEIERYIEQADQDVAVINCTIKKAGKNQFYANTTFYVGTEDFKIYRMEQNILNLPMDLENGAGFKYPPIVKTISTFKNDKGDINILESISTKMYLSVNYMNRMQSTDISAIVSSLLTVYQEDNSLKNETYQSVSKNTKDKNVVESIKYNADFWQNNPIVKQTSLEDKFSKMMEGQNAFGTMINP